MSERLYRPDKTWKKEVTELDRILFSRGATSLADSVLAVWGLEHVLSWRDNETWFVFSSTQGPRLLGNPHWGSELAKHTIFTTNGSVYPVRLTREVTYHPRGIRAYKNYHVREHTELLDINEHMELDEKETSKKLDKDLATSRRREKEFGLSQPTEETYIFLLNTLRQGEEKTRNG